MADTPTSFRKPVWPLATAHTLVFLAAFCTACAFPQPEDLAAMAELRSNSKHQENGLMTAVALRYQQCPCIACPCASFRRRCNPSLKRGTLRLGLNRLFPGLPWEALKEGNILAPCPRCTAVP